MAKHIHDGEGPDLTGRTFAICGKPIDRVPFAFRDLGMAYRDARSGKASAKNRQVCAKCYDIAFSTLASVREDDPPGRLERAAAAIRRAYVGG